MDTSQIIIGSKDFPIFQVVSLLKSSPSFSLFHDNWSLLANSLETRREQVKRLQRDYILGTISLTDITYELLNEWIGIKGKNATLQEFVRILEEIEMKSCADSLVEGTKGNHKLQHLDAGNIPKEEKYDKVKKYSQVPTSLAKFLDGKSKFCILFTPDCKITCEKIQENLQNCHFYEWKEFLRKLSQSFASYKGGITFVVRDCPTENLKKLNKKLLQVSKGDCKVVFVTPEDEPSLKEISKALASEGPSVKVCSDVMDWDDLTTSYQMDVSETLMSIYGVKIGEGLIKGQSLVDLINGNKITLFKKTLPDELSYYVERTVSSRNYVSMEIFEQTSSDVFLFTGIGRSELSILAKRELTDTSTNQLSSHANITTKFIILDHSNHFAKICDKCSNPVHLLCYKNKKLKWLKSKGGLKAVQGHLDRSQDELTEAEFTSYLSSDSNQAVVISDSPGMGKSVLLGKIGRRLQTIHTKRAVILIVLSEFIKNVKMAKDFKTNIISSIKYALETMVCENDISKRVLVQKLNSEEISIELLLDGFDELALSDFDLGYELLRTLSSLKSIRLWVTSRVHLLKQLENNLHVLGYNIKPFEEKHQITFLSSYWSRDTHDQSDRNKLKKFAKECMQVLKSWMGPVDHDIAGIPLQCLLVGQVFEEEALTGVNSSDSSFPPIIISSITELYRRMIEKKLDNYFRVYGSKNIHKTTKMLLKMHQRLSLELIFPEYSGKLEGLLQPVKKEVVVRLGIVESSDTDGPPRFLHRTFAEYFVASFVVDKLGNINGWNKLMSDFVFEQVLQCKTGSRRYYVFYGGESQGVSHNPNEEKIFVFAYPVIAYFLNVLMTDLQSVAGHTCLSLNKKCAKSPTIGIKISQSCARHNFTNLLTKLDDMKVFKDNLKLIFSKTCLFLAIDYSELTMRLVKLVLDHFELHNDLAQSVPIKTEVLWHAIARGRFSIVEFIIKKKWPSEIAEIGTQIN